ncbi:hypothetical protein BC89_28775 [Pseudomonas monteilii]|nr:hypothetical protein BC89_28775 [Pseudomonas monteilii]
MSYMSEMLAEFERGEYRQLKGVALASLECQVAGHQDAFDQSFAEAATPDVIWKLVERHQALLVELEKLKSENETLRRDKDRLDALEANGWDIRNSSSPIADTGDYSNAIEIVGRWMDKPHERVIGENYSENLRAALDQAMSAEAYPPARPEYDFCEGALRNGNRARRRAEALGIDYDAAMAKGRAQ